MNIKILGGGCANCKKLLENTELALAELGLEASIEEVKDINTIIDYGVMKTPALVVDEKAMLLQIGPRESHHLVSCNRELDQAESSKNLVKAVAVVR